jgi:hypothetical protein
MYYKTIMLIILIIFVIICFVLKRKELFSSHNSDLIATSGLNTDNSKFDALIDSIKLTEKPVREITFADELGIFFDQPITMFEQERLILWIKDNIKLPFIKFDNLQKRNDIITATFYVDINESFYYMLISIEFKINKNKLDIYDIHSKGLVTKLSVSLKDSVPTKILYDSFIHDPEFLNDSTIRNQVKLFEENKKELLLRNKVML